MELIKRNYWWLGIKGNIKKYLRMHKMLAEQSTTYEKD